jgi:hypothetical protein
MKARNMALLYPSRRAATGEGKKRNLSNLPAEERTRVRFFKGFGPPRINRPESVLPSDLIALDSAAAIDFGARRF